MSESSASNAQSSPRSTGSFSATNRFDIPKAAVATGQLTTTGLQSVSASWLDQVRAEQDGQLRMFREIQSLARSLTKSPTPKLKSEPPTALNLKQFERKVDDITSPVRSRSSSVSSTPTSGSRPRVNTSPDLLRNVLLHSSTSIPDMSASAPVRGQATTPKGTSPGGLSTSLDVSAIAAHHDAMAAERRKVLDQESSNVQSDLDRISGLVSKLRTDMAGRDMEDAPSLRHELLKKEALNERERRSLSSPSRPQTTATTSTNASSTARAADSLVMRLQALATAQGGPVPVSPHRESPQLALPSPSSPLGDTEKISRLLKQIHSLQDDHHHHSGSNTISRSAATAAVTSADSHRVPLQAADMLEKQALESLVQQQGVDNQRLQTQLHERDVQYAKLQSRVKEFERMMNDELTAVADTLAQMRTANKSLADENALLKQQQAMSAGSASTPVAISLDTVSSAASIADLRAENITLRTDLALQQRQTEELRLQVEELKRQITTREDADAVSPRGSEHTGL
eukprot:TRINITY_DN12907_c0_g1_i1.p1 TRINITY_DN12907_c0_g1~~TRINITY_DN12907_c0_g1_i1.p1  ORF type:complete len:515 (+),score=125.19 TRINITY_DN12907_c0_g1_i1:64-1608(+)